MPVTKIHCDFYEVFGLNWTAIDDAKAKSIVDQIEVMELLGNEPDMSGFVGTASVETIIGGFFAMQYEAELLHYDLAKRLTKDLDVPFARLFFVLFARTGKLVLQNRKFADLPLSMESASNRFIHALSEALQRSRVGYALNLVSPEHEECNASLILDTRLKQVTLSKTRSVSCPSVANSARNSRPAWFSKSSAVPSPPPRSAASTA